MNQEAALPLIAIPAFLVAFPLMWCAVCYLLGLMGGWQRLAGAYSDDPRPSGKHFYMRSGKMGFVNYNGCLNLTANTRGLRLKIFPLFRVGHAPVFVPWTDVQAKKERGFLITYTTLTFRGCQGVKLKLPERLARELQRASGGELEGWT